MLLLFHEDVCGDATGRPPGAESYGSALAWRVGVVANSM
jgi:hypothetical protein